MVIPIIRRNEIFSFKKIADPNVVNKKTMVAKIGYALERSLNVKTLNHITKESPYRINPPIIKGLKAAFVNSRIKLDLFPLIPPMDLTPVFSRILAVTLNVTLIKRS